MVASPESLRYLDGRVSSLLSYRKREDVEGLATLSAKRRFLRVELQTSGIDPDRVTEAHVQAATQSGCPALASYLDSLCKLRAYAGSDARRKWNPAATADDLPSQVPVASDWFLQSTFPDTWDAMDFLSRCESIWTDNAFTGEGMLFTRIFDHRVKLRAGYEDGLRLVMLLAEVGQYVPPLDLPKRAAARVEALDLVRRKYAFDDREPDDYTTPIAVPMGKAEWAFSFAEIFNRPFVKLHDALGQAAFDQIVATMGYRHPDGPFQTYTGDDRLPLYYYLRADADPDARLLILVSAGEYQPGRYMAHVEGLWRIWGANF